MNAVLATECEVNMAVKAHLQERVAQLTARYKEQEAKREAEVTRIENERNEIKDRKNRAAEEIQSIYAQIALDTEERKRREEEQ